MKFITALLGLAAAIIWAHTHTDEIPFLLGLVGLSGLLMGSLFPRRFVAAGALLGLAPIAAELLVYFGALHAPWPATALGSLPLIALVCQVPAHLGAALGWLLRRSIKPETRPPHPVS